MAVLTSGLDKIGQAATNLTTQSINQIAGSATNAFTDVARTASTISGSGDPAEARLALS